jgi:peptidoglycan/LPS O-acetylase OafA/YrhL
VGAIRLFLALVVAFDHLFISVLLPNGWVPGMGWRLGVNAGFAVMFFYMISGFLISTALHTKYSATPDGTVRFYRGRFIRLFSLYWPLTILTLLFYPPARDWMLSASTADHLSGLFLFGIDWRVSLVTYPLPYLGTTIPGLSQAWTLGSELTFYLLAPWLLRSWKLALAALLVSAAVRAGVLWRGDYHPIWSYTFLPGTLVFFLIGHFARFAGSSVHRLARPAIGTVLLAAGAVLSAATPIREWDSLAFWVSCLLFAGALPGVFAATKNIGFLNALGDLSYPVYLLHFLVIVAFESFAPALPATLGLSKGAMITACYLSLVVFAAAIAHSVIERPVGFLLKRVGRRALRPSLAPAK